MKLRKGDLKPSKADFWEREIRRDTKQISFNHLLMLSLSLVGGATESQANYSSVYNTASALIILAAINEASVKRLMTGSINTTIRINDYQKNRFRSLGRKLEDRPVALTPYFSRANATVPLVGVGEALILGGHGANGSPTELALGVGALVTGLVLEYYARQDIDRIKTEGLNSLHSIE